MTRTPIAGRKACDVLLGAAGRSAPPRCKTTCPDRPASSPRRKPSTCLQAPLLRATHWPAMALIRVSTRFSHGTGVMVAPCIARGMAPSLELRH